MNRIVYWHAPLWAVVCIISISLVYVCWLTYRNARRPSIVDIFPLINPVLGEIPMFFFTHTAGLQGLNKAALDRLAELQASSAFVDALLEAHVEARVIQEQLSPHKGDVLLVIPLASASGTTEGVLAIITAGVSSRQETPSPDPASPSVPDVPPSENWRALGPTLYLHNEQPRVRVARKIIHGPYTVQWQWEESALNAQENLLVRKLANTAGAMQTARDLFECAWPEDVVEPYGLSPSQKDRLRRLVYRLRQYIEPDPQTPEYIHTTHGLGYTFYHREAIPNDA